MSPLAKSLKDLGNYLPGKILPALTALITLPIYAHWFPPDVFSILVLVTTLSMIGNILCSNWLISSALRFWQQEKKQKNLDVFWGTLTVGITFSTLLLFIYTLFLMLLPDYLLRAEVRQFLPYVFLNGTAGFVYRLFLTLLRAQFRSKQYVLLEWFYNYGNFGLALFLIVYAQLGIESILLAALIVSTLSALSSGLMLQHRERPSFSFGLLKQNMKTFLLYGYPGAFATVGTWVLASSDRLFLEFFRPAKEMGLYAMSYHISEQSMGLFVSSYLLVFSPMLLKIWEEEKSIPSTEKFVFKMTEVFIFLTFPMIAGLSFIGKNLLQILTSTTYAEAYVIIPWVAIAAVLAGFSILSYSGIVLSKKVWRMTLAYTLAGICNALLNLFVVPKYGYYGAAITTTSSYALLLVFNIWLASPFLKWRFPWRTALKTLFASTIMLLGLVLLPVLRNAWINLFTSITVGAILYASVWLLFFNKSLQRFHREIRS